MKENHALVMRYERDADGSEDGGDVLVEDELTIAAVSPQLVSQFAERNEWVVVPVHAVEPQLVVELTVPRVARADGKVNQTHSHPNKATSTYNSLIPLYLLSFVCCCCFGVAVFPTNIAPLVTTITPTPLHLLPLQLQPLKWTLLHLQTTELSNYTYRSSKPALGNSLIRKVEQKVVGGLGLDTPYPCPTRLVATWTYMWGW